MSHLSVEFMRSSNEVLELRLEIAPVYFFHEIVFGGLGKISTDLWDMEESSLQISSPEDLHTGHL
jgi:hypothetical protein